MKTHVLAISLSLLGLGSAATILQDFDLATTGSTPPSGWDFVVDVNLPTYQTQETIVSTGTKAGNVSAATVRSSGDDRRPTGYLVNSGLQAFDARQNISVTFDFYLTEVNNRDAASFIMGDIAGGLNGNAGQLVGAWLVEGSFGKDVAAFDGTGTEVAAHQIAANTSVTSGNWITINMTWTPSSGTTGIFSINDPGFGSGWPKTFETTLDSTNVYFGFGTGAQASANGQSVYFDNINITGTAIPEPSVALISGLGLLMLLRRRKH